MIFCTFYIHEQKYFVPSVHIFVLLQVDYKGSISFRITSEKRLHKRVGRRKNSIQSREESSQAAEDHLLNQSRAPSPKKGQKSARKPRELTANKMDPVTLNLLLREELSLNTEAVVTKENIVQALDLTKRPINKRAVFRDLETILAHEIHLGYLVKRGDHSWNLASINKDKHYRGTIPLKSSKRKPKPTQKYLEMEAELQKNKSDNYQDAVPFDSDGNFSYTSPSNGSGQIKSEEELKDDLIKEKLISSNLLKIKSKMKSSKTGKLKTKKETNSSVEVGPEVPSVEIIPICTDKTNEIKKEDKSTSQENKKKSFLTAIKSKPKKEAWQVSITVKEAKPKVSSSPLPVDVSSTDTFTSSLLPLEHRPEESNDTDTGEDIDEDIDEDVDEKPKRCARKRKLILDEPDDETLSEMSETSTRTLSGRTKVKVSID